MNVIAVKFLSGQEVIGKLVSQTDEGLQLENPVTVQTVPSREGGIGVALMPFSFAGVGDTVVLNGAHILCVMAVEPVLEKQYLAAVSGIVIAPAGSVPEAREDTSRNRITLVE